MSKQCNKNAVTLSLPIALVAAWWLPAVGQEVKIVIPAAYEQTEGDRSLTGPITSVNGTRAQSVLPSELFDNVPDTHRWLKELRWRPDGNETKAGADTFDMLIRLSTTQKGVGNLDMVFANNTGPDEKTVLDGVSVQSTENIGPAGGPKEFDVVIAFDDPFYYDPEQGNLLLDLAYRGPLTATIVPDGGSTNDLASIFSNQGWDATSAETQVVSPTIFQFVFVPEPTTWVLAVLALAGVISLSRKRQMHPD